MLAGEPSPLDVDVELGAVLLLGDLLQAGTHEDAGVADHDVELAEGLLGEGDQRRHLLADGHVGAEESSATAGPLDRPDDGTALVLEEVGDDDAGSLGGEALHDPAAEPPCAACHDGNLAFEPHRMPPGPRVRRDGTQLRTLLSTEVLAGGGRAGRTGPPGGGPAGRRAASAARGAGTAVQLDGPLRPEGGSSRL